MQSLEEPNKGDTVKARNCSHASEHLTTCEIY